MNKKYFSGCYFKFITKDNKYTFAFVVSSHGGKITKQVITRDASYLLIGDDQIKIMDEKNISLDIEEQGLTIKGVLRMGDPVPPKKDVMSIFRNFRMQCKHNIYSLYHSLKGSLRINGKLVSFDGGRGYIEGDEGYAFPSSYFWYNSLFKDSTVTLAIAKVPFGLFKFTGLLCVIRIKEKQYFLATYNGAKVKLANKRLLLIKKGKYSLMVNYELQEGRPLAAPTEKGMDRLIKEELAIKSTYIFKKGKKILLQKSDEVSSMEYMLEKEIH